MGVPGLFSHAVSACCRDWVKAVEASYVPIQVADKLWIIPSWARVQDEDAVNILMEPGLAFGTGVPPLPAPPASLDPLKPKL